MDIQDVLAGTVLGICAVALGFAVFRHFVGEGSLALTVAVAVGSAVGAGYVIWHRHLFGGRHHRRH